MYRRFGKRILDIGAGVLILALTWPLFLVIGAAIYIDDPGAVLYRQKCRGKRGEIFTMLKFRSMIANAQSMGTGVYSGKDDPRVTRVGKILRRFRLDELPQAVHLISGKMSLIGPRPPLVNHPWPWEQYTLEQRHMFDVRPGITGWAQVNGGKNVEWNQRIRYSCWYADNLSFRLDMKIIVMTVREIFTGAGGYNTEPTVITVRGGEERAETHVHHQ